MQRHLAKLATLACTLGVTAVVGLGSAGAAHAAGETCYTGDNSGDCFWTFPADNHNSPNLTQAYDEFSVSVTNAGCYTGYWWNGSGWVKGAPGEKCATAYNNTANLFNTYTIGQSIHALENSGGDNYTAIIF